MCQAIPEFLLCYYCIEYCSASGYTSNAHLASTGRAEKHEREQRVEKTSVDLRIYVVNMSIRYRLPPCSS